MGVFGSKNFFVSLEESPRTSASKLNLSTNVAGTSNKKLKQKSEVNLKTLDSKPGLYSRYKPFLQKDKAFLKRLLKVGWVDMMMIMIYDGDWWW